MAADPELLDVVPRAYRSPAVEKAIDIIERLATSTEGESAKMIAEASGRTISGIYRVLGSLEARNLIRKEPGSDRYSLSMRVFELAHRHPPTERLVTLAQPIMDALSVAALQSCHLGTAEGDQLHVLVAGHSPLQMQYAVKVGSVFPLLETSSGVIITSDMDEMVFSTLVRNVPSEDLEALNARLNAAREKGFEIFDSLVVPGIVNLSAPVRDSTGRVRAAMTVPFLAQKRATVRIEEVLEMLLQAADRLSARMGHIDEDGTET